MLDAKAVAECLGVSSRTINATAKRLNVGTWTRYRTGYKRMFRSDDIDRIKIVLDRPNAVCPPENNSGQSS